MLCLSYRRLFFVFFAVAVPVPGFVSALAMEISVKFSPRSCFFSGDVVRAIIEFSFPKESPLSPPSSPVVLAWASAQIQCECVTADVGARGRVQQRPHTSFRPVDWLDGSQIMSSAPRVLFCEVALAPGERKIVSYQEQLPQDLPPSHRGKKIKITYNVLVGTQILGSSVNVLKLPFRVLNTPSAACPSSSAAPLGTSSPGLPNGNGHHHLREPQEPVAVATSPFLKESWSSLGMGNYSPLPGENDLYSPGPMASAGGLLHLHRKPVNYDISTASAGCLAKLCMPRNQFKLGEEVLATLRFPPDALTKCVQYSVSLVYTETVSDKEDSASAGGKNAGEEGGKTSSQTKVVKHQDFTYGAEECSFNLEVPHSSTPSFRTASCQLDWHLHFEFVIEAQQQRQQEDGEAESGGEAGGDGAVEWNAPHIVEVNTLEWDLPVTVLPADPTLLSYLQLWNAGGRKALPVDGSTATSMTSS